MDLTRRLAGLFSCCLVAACNSSNSPDVSNNPPPPPGAASRSLEFFGTGVNGVDRVRIPLADAAVSRPVNVGATAFTIEFWIKGDIGLNPTLTCTPGALGKDAWLDGAVVMDRDVAGDGDFGEFGVSLLGGRIAFGVSRSSGGQTLCGNANVLDSAWHHIALTRDLQTGEMAIFVDGARETLAANVGSAQNVAYNPAHATPDPTDPFLVLGAQKRDALTARAFRGKIDELRISDFLRYTGTFARPTTPPLLDGNTVALYRFDEASGVDILDADGNASPGELLPGPGGAASHRSTDVPPI